jgi:hypothetical protein
MRGGEEGMMLDYMVSVLLGTGAATFGLMLLLQALQERNPTPAALSVAIMVWCVIILNMLVRGPQTTHVLYYAAAVALGFVATIAGWLLAFELFRTGCVQCLGDGLLALVLVVGGSLFVTLGLVHLAPRGFSSNEGGGEQA